MLVIRVGADPLLVQALQLGDHRRERAFAAELRGTDAVPRQRGVARALADFLRVDGGGQAYVRLHAAVLCAVARDAVVHADRDRELAVARVLPDGVAVERVEVLHRALAVGLLADHHAAAVVLHGRREDLGRRRAEAVDQDGERAVVRRRLCFRLEHLDAAAGLAQLHDRPALDEQVHEADRLAQVAAAVLAQVEHEAVDAAFGLELVEQLADVARGAAELLLAGGARVVVLVEGRHRDDADAQLAVAALDRAQLLLGGLGFERDLGARQRHHSFLGVGRGLARLDQQPYERAVRAADEGDDVVEAPANHVHHLARLALADRDDAVGGLQLAALLRRAARQDLHDGHVVVERLQRRADALVGQAHLDAVFLGVARREIARVRVEDVRERVHEDLEHVVGRDLLAALGGALVTLLQHLARLGPGLVGQHQRDGVVLHALAPQLVELGAVLRPRRLAPVELEALVEREVGLLVEHGERELHALPAALLVAVEDLEGRLELAFEDRVVEFVAVALEFLDVGGGEVAAQAVERLEVAVEHQGRHGVVHGRLAVVRALEHAAHEPGDPRVPFGGREVDGGGR